MANAEALVAQLPSIDSMCPFSVLGFQEDDAYDCAEVLANGHAHDRRRSLQNCLNPQECSRAFVVLYEQSGEPIATIRAN